MEQATESTREVTNGGIRRTVTVFDNLEPAYANKGDGAVPGRGLISCTTRVVGILTLDTVDDSAYLGS